MKLDELDDEARLNLARECVCYDADSGQMRWLKSTARKRKAGDVAGTISRGRKYITIRNVKFSFPRLAWAMFCGEFPKGVIDHIDGNPLNNSIQNLRDVDHKTNAENIRRAKSHNGTAVLGVRKAPGGKFVARVSSGGKEVNLGKYETAQAAHDAYVSAKRAIHPGCTL